MISTKEFPCIALLKIPFQKFIAKHRQQCMKSLLYLLTLSVVLLGPHGPVFLDFACMISKNISLFFHLQLSFICFNINHLDFSL